MDNQTTCELAPSLGVDRLELNVLGEWQVDAWKRLSGLEYQSLHRLEGELVRKQAGGWHGPEFYPFSLLRRGRFRIDVFSRRNGPYAIRCYLYRHYLVELGLRGAFEWLRGYVKRLGCEWSGEQVSRVDLRADVNIPIDEFLRRIDTGCLVTRMQPGLPNGETHDSSRYFGKRGYLQVCIYDKAREQGMDGSLTRVEFRAARKFLRGRGISEISSLNVPRLWEAAGDKIRLTDKQPDKTHQSRFATWEVWEAIQQACWSKRDTFPKEKPKPAPRAKWRPPRPKRRQPKLP